MVVIGSIPSNLAEARYYNPKNGRFLQRDPLYSNGPIINPNADSSGKTITEPNLYHYTNNDPINWTDPYGLFRFGKRKLKGFPFMINHPILDKLNREVSHEHGFFEDNMSPNNVGFGPATALGLNLCTAGQRFYTEKSSDYVLSSQHFDDALMRQALENLNDGEYCVGGKNCQDWAQRLRDEYYRLEAQQN